MTDQSDSVTFCSHNFKVPEGCSIEQDNEVRCDNYSIGWTYINDVKARGASEKQKLRGMEISFIEMGGMLDKFKKKRITCFLLDTEVKGYKVSYKSAANIMYQIYASGIINGQAVSLILTIKSDPITNEDIPEFARQLIKLTK
jgi:hypothetical protein